MKRFFQSIVAGIALMLLFASAAIAAPEFPSCWPKQIGATGSSMVYGETADARWIAWTCVTGTTYSIAGLKTYMPKIPDTRGLTPVQSARAYWTANVTDTTDAKLKQAHLVALAAAKPLRP